MVSLQSSEYLDLTFMVFSRRRFLQNRALDKEKNTLRHHRAISLVYTLADHSSQPISAGEIAQLLKQIYSRVFLKIQFSLHALILSGVGEREENCVAT